MGTAIKTVALELQPCCGKRSGIGTFTWELARRMGDGGGLRFQGNLFNFLGRNDNRAALDQVTIPMNVCSLFPYGVYRRIWSCGPFSYDALFPKKADLSVFFNYIVPPRISGKVITTIYDMTYRRFPETMDGRNLRRLKGGMDYSIARSDRILTISEFSRREIVELLDVNPEKISVIPCAPNYAEETASAETLAAQHGIQTPFLLYVGNVEPRKNLPRLLRAFAELKEKQHIPHRLVIAGGKGWQTEAFDRALADSPVREEIVLTGFVPAGIKNALYQNAAAFVFPSLYEGFGIPPLEAMHFGCPVVCADAASLPEVVGEAAELVDPTSVDAIAAGILRVLEDTDHAAELVRRGYSRERCFSWDTSAQRFAALCKEILEIR